MQRLLATIDTHPRSKAGMVISTGEIKHIEDERDRGRTCQDTHGKERPAYTRKGYAGTTVPLPL